MPAKQRTSSKNCPCSSSSIPSGSLPRLSTSNPNPCCLGIEYPEHLHAFLTVILGEDEFTREIPLLRFESPTMAYTGLDGNPTNTFFACDTFDEGNPCALGGTVGVLFTDNSFPMNYFGRQFVLVSVRGAESCGPVHWFLGGHFSCTALNVCSQTGVDRLCGDKPTSFGTPFDMLAFVEITE